MTEFPVTLDPALWTAAFMAGLLGSGHCFAMCGGIAGSLGALSTAQAQPSKTQGAVRSALDFNLARLASYSLLGGLAGAFTGGLSDLSAGFSQLESIGVFLRGLTTALVAMIGLRFLLNWKGLDFLERAGSKIWSRILPVALRFSSRGDGAGRLLLGLCWGFLPCGLVYTVLLTAASTGSLFNGAATMLTFGAGTLPSMLGLTMAAPGLSTILADQSFRRIIGFSLLVLAFWMGLTMLGAMPEHHAESHSVHASLQPAMMPMNSSGQLPAAQGAINP